MTESSLPSIARWVEEALELHRAGWLSEAEKGYERALAVEPSHPDANYLTGLLRTAEGHHAQALARFERAIAADSDRSEYHHAAAASLRALGRLPESVARYTEAARLDPADAETHDALGTALDELGDISAAIESLSHACRLGPSDWRHHFHHGNALRHAERLRDAQTAYTRSLELEPNAAEVHNNLGIVLQMLGSHAEARSCFERAIALAQDYADAHNNLGAALHALEQTEDALPHFRRAIELDPRHPHARANLAQGLQELGCWREAIAAFADAVAADGRPGARVRLATVLPVIPRSAAEIVEARSRLAGSIDALMSESVKLDHPEREVATCNFHLAYHGLDNRRLQQQIAQFYLQACPGLAWRAPHVDRDGRRGGPLRIGFISRFLRNHSIGKTSRGLIARLSRPEFEAIALYAPPFVDDWMSTFIRNHADRNVILPRDLAAAREAIAALELDVLFYQDIGMDPFTYYLAFARLAPVQCVSFGHPDTTGIPNMDWWVSSANFEADAAPAHYSERLWLARDVGTLAYYYRPPAPTEPRSRDALGLPTGGALYFCPHSMFRIHPDFDSIIGLLLDRDPSAEVLMIESTQPNWTRLFSARLARTLGPAMARVRILPLQPHAAYLNLIQVCDAVLDPIYFNGMNNSLDAFAAGTPIVTMPHTLQRGRHTYGMYRRMGFTGCVARDPEDYVRIAQALRNEPDLRDAARREIAERRDVLFEEQQVVREFERFFRETARH